MQVHKHKIKDTPSDRVSPHVAVHKMHQPLFLRFLTPLPPCFLYMLFYTYPPSLFPQFFPQFFEPSPLKSDDVLFGRAHRCVPFQPFFRFNCSHKNDENRLMSFLKMFAHSFQFQSILFPFFCRGQNDFH